MVDTVRNHPRIGELRWVEGRHEWEATVEPLPGCSVKFTIVAEAERTETDPAELFEAGAKFLAWAREFEPQCRERVAHDLLDWYNRVWADDDLEGGPHTLAGAEFVAVIRPIRVSLYRTGESYWAYDPGDLFSCYRGISVNVAKDGSFPCKAWLTK